MKLYIMRSISSLRKIAVIAVLPAIMLFSFTTSCSTPHTQGPNDVWIQGMSFNPSTLTVTVGTTVTWTNFDVTSHTATSTSSIFNSGTINTNGTFSYQFLTKGTYPYVCTFHSSMKATIIVN
jgi:plastocyanin